MNAEGKGSELREGVRLKAQYLLVLEHISNSNTKNIQTAGIEDTQCQFEFQASIISTSKRGVSEFVDRKRLSVAPRDLSCGKAFVSSFKSSICLFFIYFGILMASVDGVLDLPINPRRRKGETGQAKIESTVC